ncbi:small ribosomal subunit protein uS14-like [Molossus nigricans]
MPQYTKIHRCSSTFYKMAWFFFLPRCFRVNKMGHQQLYWSHPTKFGQGSRSCRVCSNLHGLIRKYALNMCLQCFSQYVKNIGFIKLN